MSEQFFRCAHCGLPHDDRIVVCPTTGLRIDRHGRLPRRRQEMRLRSSESNFVGRVLDDKYRVTAVIGSGGMSKVYEAEHLGLHRVVALKVLHAALADDQEAIARLRHEAQVVSAIGHANICEVFDMGRTKDGSPYLVMERLRGESLAQRIENGGPLSFAELAPILLQVLAAMAAAHDKGILHRGLKPENVFIEEPRAHRGATAKLLDFGISKSMTYDFLEQQRLTHTGMVMGTPYYMAPEQARGDSSLDQRVDLWAVGVIMYEAMSGRRPFVATNYNALLVKILTSRPRPLRKLVPTIPAPVANLVDKAMSKLREDRFQSARELIAAVERVQKESGAEDAHAATMIMIQPERSRRDAATLQEPFIRPEMIDAAQSWSSAIEDPDTFVDDPESLMGEMAMHAESAVVRLPAPALETLSDSNDLYDETIEPTVQETARDNAYYESLRAGSGRSGDRSYDGPPESDSTDDTEVMRRSEFQEGTQDDTEIMNRAQLEARLKAERQPEEEEIEPPESATLIRGD